MHQDIVPLSLDAESYPVTKKAVLLNITVYAGNCTLNCSWKPVVSLPGVTLDILLILARKLCNLYAVSPHKISSSNVSWMNAYCACYITHHLQHTYILHNNICTSVCTMNIRLARMLLTHSYTLTVFMLSICCNIISNAMYVPVRPTPALNTSKTHSSHYTLTM